LQATSNLNIRSVRCIIYSYYHKIDESNNTIYKLIKKWYTKITLYSQKIIVGMKLSSHKK